MCVCHSELEGKDVEEVFTAVLRPNDNSNNELDQRQNTNAAAENKTNAHQTGTYTHSFRLPWNTKENGNHVFFLVFLLVTGLLASI